MIAERVLPLAGVHNFRDYGGYAVEGGGRLRDGSLWRSAHHEAATDDDLDALDTLGLETVIDLRGDDEREMHPCRRSENFSARVLFAGGVTAGLAPHLQAAGGTIDVETARDRMIDTYAGMPYRPALVVAAQVDDRFDPQPVDRRQVVVGRLDMVCRTPQGAIAQPSAALDGIAAIVAEIMDARQGQDAVGEHGHSPVKTGGRFSTKALIASRLSAVSWTIA